MHLRVTETTVRNVLTRTTGFLRTVSSHSLQPYRGCAYGNALCGVGCYVQHNGHVTRGRPWGGFLEVRTNAAASYREHYEREARWARIGRGTSHGPPPFDASLDAAPNAGPGRFSIFCSSSTDPFVPQELRHGVTRSVLEAMVELPPDELIVQTHSHLVTRCLDVYAALAGRCDLRFHVSIETDLDSLPGLPPHASPIERRFEACRVLRSAGLRTVVTVSPLLPIRDPEAFFERIADCADAVVIDHFISGDGTSDGSRTRRTPLPAAMSAVLPESVTLAYRERMVEIARRRLPGRVGVHIDGFAGRFLPG